MSASIFLFEIRKRKSSRSSAASGSVFAVLDRDFRNLTKLIPLGSFSLRLRVKSSFQEPLKW